MSTPFLEPEFGRCHLVILGAGASRAALPNGDKHGHKLPLMNDLVEVLDLHPLLRSYGLDVDAGDFEALYSSLFGSGQHPDLLDRLERRTWEYFRELELPDQPTLYDYLVLCLRAKDIVASFNWDPLLWQAMCRIVGRFGKDVLPTALFLHGNVAIGHCMRHDPPTQGHLGAECQRCGRLLAPSRLLFPVTQKDYSKEPSIRKSWGMARAALRDAYFLTIFGYGAPVTDAEALKLMGEAWGSPDSRELEQIEIINTRSDDELFEDWKGFIHTHHYQTTADFYGSYLAKHPRRSCEDFWEAAMELHPQPERAVMRGADWDALGEQLGPLIEQERACES